MLPISAKEIFVGLDNDKVKVTAAKQHDENRRELVRKMGKFALYAAPFTVLAATNKASAATGATGSGPRKHR